MAKAMAMMSGTCVVSGRIMEKNMGVVKGLGVCQSRLPSASPHGSVAVAKYEQSAVISSGNGREKAVAAALFAALSSCESAMAAQQVMDLAADDNRGLTLLIPIVPAVGWVLYNILQPGLNQLARMRSAKGLAVGLGPGLVAGAAAFTMTSPDAQAVQREIAQIAEVAANNNDNRGLLVSFVLVPAVLWVLFNILQPALNQLDRMKSS